MGRRQFESVVAQAPKIKVKEIPLSSSTSIPASSSEAIDVYSAAGTISTVIASYFQASPPNGAVSGSHFFKCYNASSIQGVKPEYFMAGSVYNTQVLINRNQFVNADYAAYPASSEAQGAALRSMKFDDDMALRIFYQNSTNVIQNNGRTAFIIVEEMETR